MSNHETVPKELNLTFRSKFNYGFYYHGCLRCAIPKALYGFREKRSDKANFSQFQFLNKIFEILKMFWKPQEIQQSSL